MMNTASHTGLSARALVREGVALAGALVVTLFVLHQGTVRLGQYVPDVCSDQIAVAEAVALAQGAGRAGIVGITHFPNGHIYLLLPFIKAGWTSLAQLQRVPIACVALAAGAWILLLLRRAHYVVLQALVLGAVVLLLFQPGLREWYQCLHQQSYVLACVLLLIVLCACLRRVRMVLLVGGFVCGWLAYDWVVLEVAAVLATRWCVRVRTHDESAWQRWRAIACECAWFCGGVALAIALHFAQNVVYFGSLVKAWRDLAGAAATRAGMKLGQQLSPGYYYEKQILIGRDPEYARYAFISVLWQALWTKQFAWSSMALFGMLCGAYALWCALMQRAWAKVPLVIEGGLLVVAIWALGHVWYLVFPWSAYFHTFLIFRHLFVPFILLLSGLVLVATPPAPVRRWWPTALVTVLVVCAAGWWFVASTEWLPPRLAPRGENLLVNGSFAHGLEGWSLWQHARTASHNVACVAMRDTAALLLANPEKKLLGVQQTVAVVSGAVYRVSGRAHSFGVPPPVLRGGRVGSRSFAPASGTVFGGRIGMWLPPQPEQEVLWMFEYNGWVARATVFTNQVTGTAVVYVHMGYGAVAATGAFTDIRFERL
jgi:hypothetical protein